MNSLTSSPARIAATAFVAGLILAGGLALWLGSRNAQDHSAHAGSGASAEPTIWTCSMHPQIRQPDPGLCPLCAMDLIPASAAGDASGDPRQVRLSAAAAALVQVETSPVIQGRALREVRLVGRVAPAESHLRTVSARFPGRIEFLRVDATGVPVEAGEVLMQIYAPEVLAAIAELRLPASLAVARSAARAKLTRWGFSEDDLDGFSRGVPPEQVPVTSPAQGIVMERLVTSGDYVVEGQPLLRIADLRTVWVQLEAYESDLAWLRFGQTVEVELASAPGRPRSGHISFIAPEFSAGRRTVMVRVTLANPELALRPGQWVNARVHAELGADGTATAPDLAGLWISPRHPDIIAGEAGPCPICGTPMEPAPRAEPRPGTTLLVPVTAVLLSGTRALVYVADPTAEEPTYTGREITLGPRAGDAYVVLAGLEAGENVVTRGAFKLDASLQLMARPSLMAPPDGSPARMPFLPGPPTALEPAELAALGAVADAVPALASALVIEDDATARLAAGLLVDAAGPLAAEAFADLRRTAEALQRAPDLRARRLALQPFMQALVRFERTPGLATSRPLWVVHCPMATDAGGADWLSATAEVLNPYWGDAMLRCGDVVRPFAGGNVRTD